MIRPANRSVPEQDAPGRAIRLKRLPRRLHRLGLIAAHHKWVVLLTWVIVLVIVGTLYHVAGSNTSNNLDLPGTDSQAASDLLADQFEPGPDIALQSVQGRGIYSSARPDSETATAVSC